MRPTLALAFVLAPVMLAAACGSEEPGPAQQQGECSPGDRQACPSSSGPECFRTCSAARRFEGFCQCPYVPPGPGEVDSGDGECPRGRAYVDADGDGFGVEPLVDACLTELGRPVAGYATMAGDCDDAEPRAFPGQKVPQSGVRAGVGGGDFDCDGSETLTYPSSGQCLPGGSCGLVGGWLGSVVPPCGGSEAFIKACDANSGCSAVTEGRSQTCL